MNVAVFDIDGVLSDSWHRRGYIRKTPADWPGFFAACDGDKPFPLATLPLILESAGWLIIFVTTRPESTRDLTKAWLHQHVYPNPEDERLLMYPGDDVNGWRWKVAQVKKIVNHPGESLVFEDDPQLIAAYRNLNIPVVPIFSGYYAWQVRP